MDQNTSRPEILAERRERLRQHLYSQIPYFNVGTPESSKENIDWIVDNMDFETHSEDDDC